VLQATKTVKFISSVDGTGPEQISRQYIEPVRVEIISKGPIPKARFRLDESPPSGLEDLADCTLVILGKDDLRYIEICTKVRPPNGGESIVFNLDEGELENSGTGYYFIRRKSLQKA